MSKVELAILGLLLEKDRHGYEIRREIKQREMSSWASVSTPGIYKGLARLESKKMVGARLESGTSHPDRTVYSVTQQGRDLFHGLMREAITHPSQESFNLLLGMGFCYHIDRETLLSHLNERRATLAGMGAQLAEHRTETMASDYIPENIDYIFDYFENLIEMETAWLDRTVDRIAAVTQWPEGVLKKCTEKD